LDLLYNDFIKGEVVEDDGNPKLVPSSFNQDSTAHELARGEMPVGSGEEVRSQPQIAFKQRRNKAKLEKAAMGRKHAGQAKRKAETEKFDHQLAGGHARKRSKKQEGEFGGTDADTPAEVEVADCGEGGEGAQKIPSKHGRDAGAALSTGTIKTKRARFFASTVCRPSQQRDPLSEVIKASDVIKASRVAEQKALQEATGPCVGQSHLEESSDSG
jgi:hypothetical protein